MQEQTATYSFALHISNLLDNGEKLDWAKAQKIAKDFDIKTDTEIMQACELAVVTSARKIAHNRNSIRQQYEELKDLYERQVTIRPLDTKSKVLQQYSTPCPLAYLLGKFVDKNDQFWNGKILEPSAGNGMLTIAFYPQQVLVNELDEIRIENLKAQGFSRVTNFDASKDGEWFGNGYRGIITNPPFAKLKDTEKVVRHGWELATLDYKMSALALDKMADNGKAAIIVGGKMWNAYWKPVSETSKKQMLFGQWKSFLGYIYAQYNVTDVIYVDGDNIYRKQGTQYPIVIILIDGRHDYNEAVKPRYVFDNDKDTIVQTYDQLFDRIYPLIEPKKTSLFNRSMIFWVYENGTLIKNDGWYDFDKELIRKKAEKCNDRISIKCFIREDDYESNYHTEHTLTLKSKKQLAKDLKIKKAKALMLKMKMKQADLL